MAHCPGNPSGGARFEILAHQNPAKENRERVDATSGTEQINRKALEPPKSHPKRAPALPLRAAGGLRDCVAGWGKVGFIGLGCCL